MTCGVAEQNRCFAALSTTNMGGGQGRGRKLESGKQKLESGEEEKRDFSHEFEMTGGRRE